MIKLNIKASNSIMSDKQFKLSDLIPEFSKFRTIEDKKRIGCQTVDDSLFVLSKKGKKYFKPSNVFCPECNSHDVLLKEIPI